MGKAFLLYSRMAELGYEVAQSNAAWILDKYGERGMCIGESGFCTDAERLQCVHSLWWQASEQGNEHAALLIGDAYYYGRVCVSKWADPISSSSMTYDSIMHLCSPHSANFLYFDLFIVYLLFLLRVLREIMIELQRHTCMLSPNLMHKACST